MTVPSCHVRPLPWSSECRQGLVHRDHGLGFRLEGGYRPGAACGAMYEGVVYRYPSLREPQLLERPYGVAARRSLMFHRIPIFDSGHAQYFEHSLMLTVLSTLPSSIGTMNRVCFGNVNSFVTWFLQVRTVNLLKT